MSVRAMLHSWLSPTEEKLTKKVHKREIGSFVTTLSFTYYYDHQATDGSKTGSQNIRGSKVGISEGYHRRRVS